MPNKSDMKNIWVNAAKSQKIENNYAEVEQAYMAKLTVEEQDAQQQAKQDLFNNTVKKIQTKALHFKKMYGAVLEAGLIQEELVAEPIEEEEPQVPFMANRQEEMLVWYPRKNHMHGNGGYDDDNLARLDAIRYFNTQDLLARFFIETHARWGAIGNWRQNVVGVTSMYMGPLQVTKPGGAHMPMFDYDGKNVKTQIRKDVKLLQKKYDLGDAWVYETRRGFHVYFFTDVVSRDEFYEMLEKVHCCKGYKRASQRRGYAVLRVSAKYTDFDITALYVLTAKKGKLRRMPGKAHTIRALIDLGQQCGTHFASMYPQWAHFQQDPKEGKQPTGSKRPTAKRIRKAKRGYAKIKKEPVFQNLDVTPVASTSTGTLTSAANWTTNTWITTGNNSGTGGTSGF